MKHRVRRWGARVPRLSQFASEHLLLLPLGALVAMVWISIDQESYYRFSYAASFAVNDIAMVFFFALMTKEVVEATAPNGVLHPWQRAWLPIIVSIGATIIPLMIYIKAVDILDEPVLAIAWPVPFATDVAVAYFIARVIFKPHPVIPFLILLAIASDVLGILGLAVAQASGDLRLLPGLAILVAAIAVALALQRARVRGFWPYVLLAGGLSWFAFYYSGLHPAFALVPIMPFLPHAARDPGFFVDASPGAKDTLSRFEVFWQYPAQIALFFFGLINAGVTLHAVEAGAWGLPMAVMLGKPLGVLLAAGVAIAAGFHLPHRVGWRDLIVVGFISTIGFTVGLFIAIALLPPGQLLAETKMGVLITLAGAPLAVVAAWMLGVGRFARTAS
jgi:NhaA family Na+:H+ antiporter